MSDLRAALKALGNASRVIIETDLVCEHGFKAKQHSILDGAVVVAECMPGVEVVIVDLPL